MNALLALILGDPQADRAVPATGTTARLTVFVSAVMAFLAMITLAISFTTARVADVWAQDLAKSATLRLPVASETADAMLMSALEVLETSPGVTSVRALSRQEQQDLLAPWFGPDLPLQDLPRMLKLPVSNRLLPLWRIAKNHFLPVHPPDYKGYYTLQHRFLFPGSVQHYWWLQKQGTFQLHPSAHIFFFQNRYLFF